MAAGGNNSTGSVCTGVKQGFGPDGDWLGWHHVVDYWARITPQGSAIEDANGAWSYSQLSAFSCTVAQLLRQHGLGLVDSAPAPDWKAQPQAPRPVALCVFRSKEFFAMCLGVWRLGIPVAAMSRDLRDKSTEEKRNRQILDHLRPFALLSDDFIRKSLVDADRQDLLFINSGEIVAAMYRGVLAASPQEAEIGTLMAPMSAMAYVYTGGTTKASKCVTVTHAMTMWEAENYSLVLGGQRGREDKMLQYSSLYWGAAAFGQISVGLSVGACVCVGGSPQGCAHGAGDALGQLAADVAAFGITVLGVVPSQLRGAWPGGPSTAPSCLKMLILWADKCPVELSRLWSSTGMQVVDLLLASEYWLALYSDCTTRSDGGVQKHVYRQLPSLDARFLVEEGSCLRDAKVDEVGEMYLSGPTTSPGYVCPSGKVSLEFHEAARVVGGKTYLRTRDLLRLLPGGGLVYAGRADSMMKHGGQWMDVNALEDAVTAVPGVTQVAVIPGPGGIDAFVVLHSSSVTDVTDASPLKRQRVMEEAPFRTLANVRKVLPSASIHLCTDIALNSATAKVDRKALAARLTGLRERRQEHIELQLEMETRAVRHYARWCHVGLLLVCGPQLLLAAIMPGLLSVAACVLRLAVLPVLWAAGTYLEFWHPTPAFVAWLKRHRLPGRWSRWLPLLAAACLPPSLLAVLGGIASAYLSLAREKDFMLAATFGSLAVLLALSVLLPFRGVSETAAALMSGLVAIAVLGLSSSAKRLSKYLLATPGLFYQLLPRFLVDEFGWLVERPFARGAEGDHSLTGSLWERVAALLRAPRWQGSLHWNEGAAVVDCGNRWDRVWVEGDGGQSWRDSISIIVHLHWNLEGSPDLKPVLECDEASKLVVGATRLVGETRDDPLKILVERVCGSAGGDLHRMDSLQAIQLAEAVRREVGRPLSVADVLRATDLEDLRQTIRNAEAQVVEPRTACEPPREEDPYRRIWLCGMGDRMCTVDWMTSRSDRSRHLNMAALQRAVDRLVARHVALRARNNDEQPMFDPTYMASSLWQLWCSSGQEWTRSGVGRLCAASIYESWPRTKVMPPGAPGAKIDLLLPTVGQALVNSAWDNWSDDEHAFWVGGALVRSAPAGQLFRICAIPVLREAPPGAALDEDAGVVAQALPPEAVHWYIYAQLRHDYCDGPTGLPLLADLLRLYAEEVGEVAAEELDVPPDALGKLQQRLWQSLKPLPEAQDPNEDIYHDGLIDWGYRNGYQRLIRFDTTLIRLLRSASQDLLGCSIDVAWLTVLSAGFLRMFPDLPRLDLFLIVTCRDKPGEERMVGYFSSRKILPIEVGDARGLTLLGLADKISTARRHRAWHRPRPFEKCGTCIEVNIVSQVAEGLPFGFQEVRYHRIRATDWHRGNTSCMNLRLDQIGRDDWDFWLQSHDAAYGVNWSSLYAQAMGSILVDMATAPNGPVVPSAEG